MQIKIHKAYRTIVTVCDSNLIGKTFEQGIKQIEIRENFFKGDEKNKHEVIEILKQMDKEDATFNLVGNEYILIGKWDTGVVYHKYNIKTEKLTDLPNLTNLKSTMPYLLRGYKLIHHTQLLMPTANKLHKYNIETDYLEYISNNIYKTFYVNDKIEIIVYTIVENKNTLLKYKSDVLEKVHIDALLKVILITNDEKYIYYVINEDEDKTKLIRYNTISKKKKILYKFIGILRIIRDKNNYLKGIRILHYDIKWILFDKKYNM